MVITGQRKRSKRFRDLVLDSSLKNAQMIDNVSKAKPLSANLFAGSCPAYLDGCVMGKNLINELEQIKAGIKIGSLKSISVCSVGGSSGFYKTSFAYQ